MALSNEKLQEKFMDALRAIESASPETQALQEIKALKRALKVGKQKLDRVGPPPAF